LKPVVFDFEANWDDVLRVVDDPIALHALDTAMTEWCEFRGGRRAWLPENGPWWYSQTDAWCMQADSKFEVSPEFDKYQAWIRENGYNRDDLTREEEQICCDMYGEFESHFYPQPETPDWYRCWGSCHYMIDWNLAIGWLLFPERDWYALEGDTHQTAVGISDDNEPFLLMDILWGKDYAKAIWPAVENGEWELYYDGTISAIAN